MYDTASKSKTTLFQQYSGHKNNIYKQHDKFKLIGQRNPRSILLIHSTQKASDYFLKAFTQLFLV